MVIPYGIALQEFSDPDICFDDENVNLLTGLDY